MIDLKHTTWNAFIGSCMYKGYIFENVHKFKWVFALTILSFQNVNEKCMCMDFKAFLHQINLSSYSIFQELLSVSSWQQCNKPIRDVSHKICNKNCLGKRA